jgi:hypothetical protein
MLKEYFETKMAAFFFFLFYLELKCSADGFMLYVGEKATYSFRVMNICVFYVCSCV